MSDPVVLVEKIGGIVTGAGRAFCAGMDLKQLGSGGKESRGDKIGNPMDEALAGFDRPILYERALANKSAMEMDADRIAQRRTGIQQRNRVRTQGD